MLDELKVLLGIDAEDYSLDEKLMLIISTVTARLKILLGGIEPPESLDYIIREVSIVRYNKIGSEGIGSHTVDGESLSYNADDFAPYAEEIQAYLDTVKGNKIGRVRFL